MTNAELRKALVAEMTGKKPSKSRIIELNAAIEKIEAEVAALTPTVFQATYGAPEPMLDCKA